MSKTFFYDARECCTRENQNEIRHRNRRVDFKRTKCVADKDVCLVENFVYRDHGSEGGIFELVYVESQQVRQHVLERLRKNDAYHDRRVGESKYAAGFELVLRDRCDSCMDCFCHKRGKVEGKRNKRGNKRTHIPREKRWGDVVEPDKENKDRECAKEINEDFHTYTHERILTPTQKTERGSKNCAEHNHKNGEPYGRHGSVNENVLMIQDGAPIPKVHS